MKISVSLGPAALVVLLASAACLGTVNLYYAAPTDAVREQAKKMRPPLWKVSLGPASIEEMQQIAPDRILLGLKRIDESMTNLEYLLVNTRTGQVLWRFVRDEDGDYRIVLATGDLVLFRKDRRGQGSLTALDAANGTVRWSRSPEASPVYLPLAGNGNLVAIERKEGTARFSALDVRTGNVLWSREVRASDPLRMPLPVPADTGIVHFYGGTELMAAKDGRTVWKRDDVRSGLNSPPPQITGRSLVLIDETSVLHVLDSDTGKELVAVKPDPSLIYTNIFPVGDMIFLRGETREHGGKRFRITAVRRADGRAAWSYSDDEPSVSGLLLKDNRIYFATPSKLVSLEAAGGRRVFRADAATTGRAYPVHVKAVRGKVVFIGELTIAAYDPASGKELYSIGMTPIQDLDSCDLLIKKSEEALASKQKEQKPYSWAGRFSQEAAQCQNLSNQYHNLGSQRYSEGRLGDSKVAYGRSQIEGAYAKAYSQMAFYSAMDELNTAMQEAFKTAELKGTLSLYQYLRQTILAAYDAAEEGDYVFRPDTKDNFSGITVIHLPTGASRHYDLSPSYEQYGLWNRVNFQKGIVYHHGIGMEPDDYVFAEPFSSYRGGVKVRQFNSYLIAHHVDIPR